MHDLSTAERLHHQKASAQLDQGQQETAQHVLGSHPGTGVCCCATPCGQATIAGVGQRQERDHSQVIEVAIQVDHVHGEGHKSLWTAAVELK